MSLLEFARGPGMEWSLMILVAGMAWRLVGALLLRRTKDLSDPRQGASGVMGSLRAIVVRSFPHRELAMPTAFPHIVGYTMHIGIGIVVFGFIPHILFFENVIGTSWPGLSNNIIEIAALFAIVAMVAQLIRRVLHPVLRTISTPDDYMSWLVTILPLLTGVAAHSHWVSSYETIMAIHILSVELLFIWIPFSKLMHGVWIVPSRAHLGAVFGRRGVRI